MRWAILVSIFLFVSLFFQEDLTPYMRWETVPPTALEIEIVQKITAFPFLFLDEGGQSKVYVSQDGKYVLKLFKWERFRPRFFAKFLPSPWSAYHGKRRLNRLDTVLSAHLIAYEKLREESGLEFLQLRPRGLHFPAQYYDQVGILRTVDLGETAFVLQRRGELLKDHFVGLSQEEIDQKALKVQELFLSEYAKGIYDTDHGVMHNIGFVDDRPIHIDIGCLVEDERIKDPKFVAVEMAKVMRKIPSSRIVGDL